MKLKTARRILRRHQTKVAMHLQGMKLASPSELRRYQLAAKVVKDENSKRTIGSSVSDDASNDRQRESKEENQEASDAHY